MKKAILALGLIGLLSGCNETTRPSINHGSELDAAILRQKACLASAAQRLDDGVSDAATIGRVVAGVCQKEASEAAVIASSTLSPAARRIFLRDVREVDLELAVEAVLATRLGRPF